MAKQKVKFTETTTKKVSATGMLDIAQNAIIVDGEIVSLSALLHEFDGMEIKFDIAQKTEEELDVPEVEDEDEE